MIMFVVALILSILICAFLKKRYGSFFSDNYHSVVFGALEGIVFLAASVVILKLFGELSWSKLPTAAFWFFIYILVSIGSRLLKEAKEKERKDIEEIIDSSKKNPKT
ncbi:hypothetical protein ACVBEJ_07050 [Porticoccus sp. GXU_MW_L64]